MTEREKSPEGFLERWSRKKTEAEREARAPAPIDSGADEIASESAPRPGDSKIAGPAAAEAEFDLAKLPSLDSITALTDIRSFLAPGVPKDIARAALRRAWAADPAIRDFKGLAENDWDFTDPTAMPGFGELPPGTDVKKLVAQIFGDDQREPDPRAAASPPAASAPEIAEQPQPKAEPVVTEDKSSSLADSSAGPSQFAKAEIVRCDNIAAPQHSNSEDELNPPKQNRQHGGALPQ